MDVLALTSPHLIDADGATEVAAAQALLAVNRFDDFAPYGDASQSGEFGEATAGACHRAKFWLGWPAGDAAPTFGRNLRDYLSEARSLPPRYKARRLMRIRRAKRAKKNRAMETAISQIGVKESPAGSNRVKYTAWYGMVGAWCAMFVTWCGVSVGETGFARGSRWAYVPYLEAAVADHRYGMTFISSTGVRYGDLVTYDWDHDGVSDHIGRFERWKSPGVFYAIEGNTSVSSDSNGGEVMRRERSVSLVRHFIHLDD